MKRSRLFLISSLAMFLGLGVAVGISFKKEAPVEKAEAATSMNYFYLDCSSLDGWDSESVCWHSWDGSKDVYVEGTKVDNNYWYVYVNKSGCSGYRWYRCEPGNTGTRWNESGWNSTISNNYCSIKGWDSNATFSGDTKGCLESYEVASTSPSVGTKRIWLDPKNNFYDSGARAALRTFSGDTHLKTYILGGSSQYKVVGDQTLFYVDIPVSADCQLLRLHNKFNFVWTYGGNFSEISGYNTANVVYSWAADAGYSAANEETATVDYAKALLDGYSTCVNSALNGYANISNIKTCVLNKLSSADSATFRSATFTAAGYGTRTYGDKVDLMENQNSSSSSRIVPMVMGQLNSSTTLVVVLISSISAVAIGGFFFLRKKRLSK